MPRLSTSRIVTASLVSFALAGTASAQTVQESFGTEYRTNALTGFNTFTQHMAGMTVTGHTSNGIFTETWRLLGQGQSGPLFGVQNSNFLVFLPGGVSSGSGEWTLLATGGASLNRLEFHGARGGTVFDRWFNFAVGTPGSSGGSDFVFETRDLNNTTVTYRNAVGVGGNAPVGDLFETVDVVFGTPLANQSLDFFMDTDNTAANSPIIQVVTATPEPASVVLFATGLVGIALARRRRRFVVVSY